MPLCNACGEKSIPTELEIWAAIRARRIVAGLCVGLDDTRCLVHEGFELDEDDGICARGRREIYDCGCSCVKVAHGLCDVYDGCGLERTRERAGDVE